MSDWDIKLLYDGDCPFCVREVRFLRKRSERRGGRLAFEDISRPEFDPGQYGLTYDTAMSAMHGIAPDGTILRGMDAFRRAYRAVGLGWLLAPTAWPVLRPCFDWGYRTFARNRVRLGGLFGRTCADGTCDRAGVGPSEAGEP